MLGLVAFLSRIGHQLEIASMIPNKDNTEFGFVITDWKSNKKKNFEETLPLKTSPKIFFFLSKKDL
jgi:hypothetical protein